MNLQKPVSYSRDFDRLVATLISNLRGTDVPSLATAIGDPKTRIQLDYKADSKRKPLRLTTEMSCPCDAARHEAAQAWIDMLSGTFALAAVRELKAIVPASTAGAALDALYPSLFGRFIWQGEAVSRLLGGRAAEIKLSLNVAWTADAVELKPTGRFDVKRYPPIVKDGSTDIASAERFVAQYWSGFCREAAPWILGSGISRLVIAGELHASDRLFAD